MNTTENNKLIAKFLGLQLEQDQERLFISGLGTKLINETFNKDWNWLMEVVEKIEDLNYSIEINKQEENDYQCLVVKKDILIQEFSKAKIEAVYNACVTFIEWYNSAEEK